MRVRLYIHLGIGVALSFIGSVILALTIIKAAQRGSLPIYVMEAWWRPGKQFATALAYVMPPEWIHGSPNNETYWPAVSSMGFVILCSVAIWTLILLGVGLCVSRYVRSKRARRPNSLTQPTGRERPAAAQR